MAGEAMAAGELAVHTGKRPPRTSVTDAGAAPGLLTAAVVSSFALSVLVWTIGLALQSERGAQGLGAPADLAESALTGLTVVVASVGTFGSFVLATTGKRRRQWLLIGAGLFLAAGVEATASLRASVEAFERAGLAPRGTRLVGAEAFVIVALVVLEVLAVSALGVGGRARSRWPAVALLSGAGLAVTGWGAVVATGVMLSDRLAGGLLSLSCLGLLAEWVLRTTHRVERFERLIALSLVLLAESGAAIAVGGSGSWLGELGASLLGSAALWLCASAVCAELFRGLSLRRRLLDRMAKHMRRLHDEIRGRELERRSAEHQMRSALLVVRSGIELLERSLADRGPDPRVTEAFGYLRSGVASVAQLIEEPSGSLATDLVGVVEREVGAARQRGMQVVLSWALWKMVPSDDPEGLGELSRVLRELLENAERHAPGAAVWVEVSGPPVMVRVWDKGPGIPGHVLEELESLPWPELARRSEKISSGHGLGLLLVRSLVERAGGQFVVSRPVAGGTCCTIMLPSLGERGLLRSSERVAVSPLDVAEAGC